MQLSLFDDPKDKGFDWKNSPLPEVTFADLSVGDAFVLISWDISRGWLVLPGEIMVKVLQPTISSPNAIALRKNNRYPYRRQQTAFFRDVAVKKVAYVVSIDSL